MPGNYTTTTAIVAGQPRNAAPVKTALDALDDALFALEGAYDIHTHAGSDLTGTVPLTKGGLGADASAFSGFLRIAAGASSAVKYNLAATAAPGISDDTSAGYVIGSLWVDTTNDKVYMCTDNTVGAAVWKELSPAGVGGAVVNFTDLGDVPASYAGAGGYLVKVNSGATGLEFVAGASQAYLELDDQAVAPSNPAAGFGRLYLNSTNGKLYLLDSSGVSRQLRTHSYGATIYKASNTAIATGTDTAITFDTAEKNTQSMWSAVTNPSRITAPVAGWYAISANVWWDVSATGIRRASIRKNGTTDMILNQTGGIAGDGIVFSLARTVYLAANDYVTLQVLQSSGGNLNILYSGGISPYLTLQYLGED